jgi:hypothetical protein
MNRSLQLWASSVMLVMVTASTAAGQAPAWWAARQVVASGGAADDFASINLGQLKFMAHAAYLEMQDKLPGGAGAGVTSLVTPWLTPTSATDDYALVTLGQLKHVAKPFYDRLIAAEMLSDYPWTATSADDDDYAVANLGQAKHVFSFALPAEPPP